jgi:hypothetical protein
MPTPCPKSAPDRRSAEQVWFFDTSALVTLSAHPPLRQAVEETLSVHRRVLVNAVVLELEGLASMPPPEGKWAKAALGQLDWLGKPVRLDDPVGTDLALEVQEELAAGRGLKHPAEHYGEAAIIALASRAQTLRPLMLSDDYNARVAAHTRGIRVLSVHKLLHLMVKQKKIVQVGCCWVCGSTVCGRKIVGLYRRRAFIRKAWASWTALVPVHEDWHDGYPDSRSVRA